MTPLHRLAAAAGLQVDWEDAAGDPQRVSDDALRAVLAALGLPAERERDVATSLDRLQAGRPQCRFASADRGQPFLLPPGCGAPGEAELALEDGGARPIGVERTADGLRAEGIAEIGYHRLRSGADEIRLAIAPARCFAVGDAAPGRRLWGPAVQIPALRGAEARAFGDFGTLADAARGFAAAGADALAVSPTHALFPADGSRFSPYAPSSRLFLNVLFGDPGLIGQPSPPAEAPDLIDWERAIPARIAALRAAFAARREALAEPLAAFRGRMGGELERHATYDALHAHFFAGGARGWQDWPQEFHDPAGAAVARFAAQHREEIDFFVFAQWLAKQSLDAAQRAATGAGMALGLIADLAVGIDGGGSHAWSRRDELLTGVSIGAPPDLLGPQGQNWGITGFSPAALLRTGFDGFIATLRAGLDHAGGIRIDHALGLRRLWVIPHGASSAEGAYLTMPLDHMLRVLAIESHNARAVVIGEDLGTVPEGLRPALDARGVLGMQVLWFEREDDGSFVPPARWRRQAAAMTGTHDLATVAGWWRGRDIDWNAKLGRGDGSEAESRAERAADRKQLWQAFRASGAASGGAQPAPDDAGPVADAALAHVGSTPSELAVIPLEDIAGLVEQPNLPGTTDQHPNWRRRMPSATADLLAEPAVARRLRLLDESRR